MEISNDFIFGGAVLGLFVINLLQIRVNSSIIETLKLTGRRLKNIECEIDGRESNPHDLSMSSHSIPRHKRLERGAHRDPA